MRIILLLSLTISCVVNSQITLTDNDFGDGGDTARISTADDPSIDFVTTGANQSWDYSNLTAIDQKLVEFNDLSNMSFLSEAVFGMFAPAKYKATYSLPSTEIPLDQISTFLPVTISDVVQYSKLSTDSLTSVGFSLSLNGSEIPFKSDTIETRYKFPADYTDTYSSRGYTKLDMNPIFEAIWIQYRQRYSEVDGWGSIVTPYGTFNALRIKHEIHETDSLQIPIMGNPFWIGLPIPITYQYEWWTNGEKLPILKIETRDVGGNETVSAIEYRDNYLGLDAALNEFSETEVEVFPNPTTDYLSVSEVSKGTYIIIDASGQLIKKGDFSESLSTAELPAGNYVLHLISGNSQFTSKFIKK